MADLDALVASPWWRWMEGMRAVRAAGGSFPVRLQHGSESTVIAWDDSNFSDCARAGIMVGLDWPGVYMPDVTDPATVGCLLALMYEAEPQHVTPSPVGVYLSQYGLTDPRTVDAIVSAILAAPPPGVDRG